MTPFYVTTFQSPHLCNRLLNSLDDLVYSGKYNFIISDQSNDHFSEIYKRLAEKHGCEYLRYPNKGATQAKRSVLSHALEKGYEFCHQISEDFIRTTDETKYGPVVTGSSSFDEDALTVLKLYPHLAFCKWNVLTCKEGDMFYLYSQPSGIREFNLHHDVKVPYLTRDIGYTNWCATWKVKGVEEIRQKSLTWKPQNDKDIIFNRDSGGEWALNMSSLGKGACLVAQPFFHPERIKDKGSLP